MTVNELEKVDLTKAEVSVGIIGMGDMGKLYARTIGKAGWR